MKKRLLALTLVLCMVVCWLPATVLAETESEVPVAEDIAAATMDAPTEMWFNEDHITGYIGYEDVISCSFNPYGTSEEVTMVSSDTSVADVVWEEDPGWWVLIPHKLGTTTITATTASGLTATCPVTVKEIETLELEEKKTVTVHEGDIVNFYFTPDETAQYSFVSENGKGNLNVALNYKPYYSDGVDTYWLKKGETVRVALWNYYMDDLGEYTFTVCIKKSVPLEKITVWQEVYTGFPGNEMVIRFDEYPLWHQFEDYTLTSSDTSVATIDGRWLTMHAPGTATVTITSTSGITATCQVKVLEPELIHEGEEKIITMYRDEERQFSFTPETSGEYVFYVPVDEVLYDENGNITGSSYSSTLTIFKDGTRVGESISTHFHHGKKCYMEAGKTYFLSVYQYGAEGECVTRTASIQKLENPQNVYFEKEKIEVERDDIEWFDLYLLSSESVFFLDDVTWTSSDPNVVSVSGSSGIGFCYVRGPGTAIITATLSNGVSASCEITVKGYEEINAGDERTITLASGNGKNYSFTPETSGYYVFYSGQGELIQDPTTGYYYNSAFSTSIINVDYSEKEYVYNALFGGNMCYMEAGKTYDLHVYYHHPWDDTAALTDTVYLEVYEPPKYIYINSAMEHCWPNDLIWFVISCTEGFISVNDQITWTTSNANAVQLVEAYPGGSADYKAIAPGTATITATLESGASISQTITVHEAGVYTVIDGADTVVSEGKGESLTVRADGHLEWFEGIKVDGKEVAEENYTATSGSTIIELHADYLATLAPGKHTLDICFKDGNATTSFTIEDDEPEVEFVGASLSLKGDIGLNFFITLPEEIRLDENAYMKFSTGSTVKTVPLSQGMLDASDGSYRYSIPLNAKNMGDNVTAQVFVGDTPVSDTKTLSIKFYADYMIANSANQKLVNLMKSMLNYGAAAQVNFGYDTSNLVNADMSAADRTLPANLDVAKYAHSQSGTEAGIEITNASLLLQSETKIRIYFKLASGKTLNDYVFTVDGAKVTPVQSGSEYYIEKTNVAAKDLDTMYTFRLGGRQLTYCGLSYVNQVLNYSKDENLLNLVKSLYAYNQAANDYFGK